MYEYCEDFTVIENYGLSFSNNGCWFEINEDNPHKIAKVGWIRTDTGEVFKNGKSEYEIYSYLCKCDRYPATVMRGYDRCKLCCRELDWNGDSYPFENKHHKCGNALICLPYIEDKVIIMPNHILHYIYYHQYKVDERLCSHIRYLISKGIVPK